LLSFFFAST